MVRQRLTTILDTIDGKFVTPLSPPPPPQIKDGKMARFGSCAASSLLWGGGGRGGGFAVPFYSVQDCSFLKNAMRVCAAE